MLYDTNFMTDPIADMLTRIRNASSVHKPEVIVPASKIKLAIANILVASGFLNKVSLDDQTKELKLELKYDENKRSAIEAINRVSRPGRRVYATNDNLPSVLNNLGLAIVSTSQGLMTNKDARKRKLGGEIICEIW